MRADGLYEQFRLVFEKFYNPLCKYANSFVKEESVCEDIVQEVFVRIWETRKDLIQSDSLRFYLFTAVRNNSLTYLSREQRLPVYSLSEMDLEDNDAIAEMTPSSEETVNYQALLGQGIEQLPPKCKEVFLLSRMGELSNQEVADSLGISVKTVNNQLWKALKLLKAFARSAGSWILIFL
ncbi:MAG TPA: RNA polymerase sigma-70 factor [Chitinophaga sp.]|uniref:RNA polymerase sigma-70 factor n=1 Tax=Chitinophaga sp. TaxID=1869181 RepID=UPI002CC7F068|nr:RNA polymerase sigma-70 factor [Chitinophaga sp.]HVI45722.1 RNA polymerase sigma-70 factor [Chitinophaga sp.]